MSSGNKINIDYSKEYDSNYCGKFKILKELEHRKSGSVFKRRVRIKFIETGYEKDVDLLVALSGRINDPYHNSICGVACLGLYKDNPLHCKKVYDIWYHMIERCYDEKCKSYKTYGAIGVRVDERWMCYENFLNDLPYVSGFREYINNQYITYNLDKDLLQQNIPKSQRIYSKDTCCFISMYENLQLMAMDNKDGCSSEYYGVYKITDGQYQSSIMINHEKHFLGTFQNELDAAYAYNQEALKYPETIHNINKLRAINVIAAKVVKKDNYK